MKLTPWQRIVRAADSGRGIRLTYKEAHQLRYDDAIATKASNDDEEQGRFRTDDYSVPREARGKFSLKPGKGGKG